MRKNSLVLLLVLYPVCVLAVAAGLLAFILSLLKIEILKISCAVWWFLFAGLSAVFFAGREVLRRLEMEKIFLIFLLLTGTFSILSLLLLL